VKRPLAVALAVVALAGCGGSDGGDATRTEGTTTERTDSPSLAPTPEPTAAGDPPTATAPSAPSPPLDATGPEEQPGGAGDEMPVRTRVRVVLDGEGLTPPRIEVPAFLALRLTVRNDLPRRVTVVLRGGHRPVSVRGRATRRFDVGGLQRGEYRLDAGEAGRGVIVAR
jgi:hypothetical protein